MLCFLIVGGYLPLNFFQWTNLNGKASHRYISARFYTTNRLCHWFGITNHELLPLCAVLTGNDYGAPKDGETLLALLDLRAPRRGSGRVKDSFSRIESLLFWLSTFSNPAEALEEVSRLMGEGRDGGGRGKRRLSFQLNAAMQEYHNTQQSSLAPWFSGGKAAPGGGISGLPECLSLAAAQGLLTPLVVDALVMRRVLLIPQVENSKLASSHCSARTIRQAVYGILLQRVQDVQAQDIRAQENISQDARGGRGRGGRGVGGGQVGGGWGQGIILPKQQGVHGAACAATVQAQGCGVPICVEEYDRMDLNLKKNQEEARPPRTPLRLDTLSQVNIIMYVFSDCNNFASPSGNFCFLKETFQVTFPSVLPYCHPGSCGSSSWCSVGCLGGEGVCPGAFSSPPEAGCSSDRLLAARGYTNTLAAPAPGFGAGHGLWRAVLEHAAWSFPLPTCWLVVLL